MLVGLQILSSALQTVASRSRTRLVTAANHHRGAPAARWMSSSGLPGDRLPKLKQLLEARRQLLQSNTNLPPPLRIMETHSGLTGLIAEHAVGNSGVTFDGMWSSSLTASAVRGMPDIEAVDTSARLDLVTETLNVTTKPMIYDGDTGGLPEIFKFTVRSLEQLGVSAVIIEDKEGLKQNSLLENSDHLHQLVDIEQFCHKIKVGLEARRSDDFMIIARMESLIAGRPMEEAIARATACVDAGASGIMIHSRQKSPAEVMEFLSKFRACPGCKDVEVVVVPSSYNQITEAELGRAGASICIYANQLLRASYPAMMGVAQSILTHSRSHEASADLMGIKEITGFIDHDAQMAPPLDVAARPLPTLAAAPNASLRQPSSKRKRTSSGILDLQTTTKNETVENNVLVELARAFHGTAVAVDNKEEEEEAFADAEEPLTTVEKSEPVCPTKLVDFLQSRLDINFFTGVPDSCIKKFCSEIDRQSSEQAERNMMVHAIAANEGAAVALAVGHHLATGNVPLVYMQNSGLGNAVNPVLSAAHPEVYGIPMVMVLGWRGSPGVHDEPQHLVTGRQSEEILKSLEVETFILPKDQKEAENTLLEAHDFAKANSCPVAVLIEPHTFSGNMPSPEKSVGLMTREEALSHILDTIGPDDAVVATTGFTSRELYELRGLRSESRASDFLCVGNMGHAIAVAQGIAIAQPDRTVWCIDGDGAALMHMGSLAMSSSFGLSNLRHVLINNDVHESVGGQKTAASQDPRSSQDGGSHLCFQDLATSVGYRATESVESLADINEKLADFAGKTSSEGRPRFIEVKISVGTRSDLGRPKNTPIATKEAFMKFLQQEPSSQ